MTPEELTNNLVGLSYLTSYCQANLLVSSRAHWQNQELQISWPEPKASHRVRQLVTSLVLSVLGSTAGKWFHRHYVPTLTISISFLVADQVYVSSVAPKSNKQYVFSSSAEEGSFEIYEDPRGNTLGRGTEITLILKDDSFEYLYTETIANLV